MYSSLPSMFPYTQVADRWQAPQALAGLSAALCSLGSDLFPTALVYALPVALLSSLAFAELKKHAEASLLSVFGDAAAIAVSHGLLEDFLLLPQAGVCTLLQSASLKTDAEVTVLLLLSEWCQGDFGKACTQEELQQLNALVRYSRLSIPYLTELYDSLHSPPLTIKQRLEVLYWRSLSEPSQAINAKLGCLLNPVGWYLPVRPKPTEDLNSSCELNLAVTEADIRKLVQAIQLSKTGGPPATPICSKPRYAQGYWWSIQLSGSSKGELWGGFKAHGVKSLGLGDTGIAHLSQGVVCEYSFHFLGIATDEAKNQGTGPVDSGGYGWSHKISEEAEPPPAGMEWWQPKLVGGCMNIVVTMSNIQA